jgi:hypothetical protein
MSRVIIVGDDGTRTPDADFVQRLREFDNDLTVFWNPRRERWCIEQCIEHDSFNADGTHSNLCRRIHVKLVQDADKEMMPLCQRVIDGLAEDRKFTEQFGEGPQSLERFHKYVADLEAEDKAKRERKRQEIMRDNAKDHKRQLEAVRHLMQQHDMRPNR